MRTLNENRGLHLSLHDVLLSTCLHHRHILCEHRQHSEMRTAATIPILTFLVYTVVLGQDEFNTQQVATSGMSRRFGFHHMGSSFAAPADTSVEVANQPQPIITSKPYAYDFRISSSIWVSRWYCHLFTHRWDKLPPTRTCHLARPPRSKQASWDGNRHSRQRRRGNTKPPSAKS